MTDNMSIDQAAQVMRSAMRDVIKRYSTWYVLQGILMIVTGIIALLFPVFSSVAVVVVLGWMLIISGAFQAISLVGATHVPHFWLQLVSVALSVLIGALFLRDSAQSLVVLTLLLLVFFMVGGMAKIVFALSIRPFPNWVWILVSGIIGVLLAAFLWSRMPVTAGWLLGVLVGIQFITEGAALAYMAWNVRKA